MPELHRQSDDSQLAMVHGPAAGRDPSSAEILKPEAIKRAIASGYLQRAVPTLCRIRAARDDGRLTPAQAADYLEQLQKIVRHEISTDILERYPEEQELKTLFGENYLGPEAVYDTWNVEIRPDQIPPIWFDPDDLRRSAASGEILRLRISRGPDGSSLTPKRMHELLNPRFSIANRSLFVPSTHLMKDDEPFYSAETPNYGWVLTKSEILHRSTWRDYFRQIAETTMAYLKQSFDGRNVPQIYLDAIAEFENYRAARFGDKDWDAIREVLSGKDSVTYARELASLDLAKLLCPTAAELIYDLVTSQDQTNIFILSKGIGRTRSLTLDNKLIEVGFFTTFGMHIYEHEPSHSSQNLGFIVSRSH